MALDAQTLAREAGGNSLSVSEALAIAKNALEQCTLTLVGEVSEVSNKAGYKAVYFSVKDEKASLPCVMWNNRFKALGIELREGMLVQLTGRFSLYAAKGRMNFDVFTLALAGEGNLRLKVANLAKKLQAEGLMEPSRKRPLPPFPEKVGLVTSPRGAAVHDVLRTLRRRFPYARVLLAGVPVEGAQAPRYLQEGLSCVAEAGAEVVLLVRGGGSFEDLMPFNDEELARTIAGMPVPVVTGIGHEPDNSIADMVADYRASTPTAAAESIAPDALELAASLAATNASVSHKLLNRLETSRLRIDNYEKRPVLSDGHSLFANESMTLDANWDRLLRAIPNGLARDKSALDTYCAQLKSASPLLVGPRKAQLENSTGIVSRTGGSLLERYASKLSSSAARLEDLSPLSVLGRGFALVKDAQGNLVKEVAQVAPGQGLTVRVSDGTIDCQVTQAHLADQELLSWKDE